MHMGGYSGYELKHVATWGMGICLRPIEQSRLPAWPSALSPTYGSPHLYTLAGLAVSLPSSALISFAPVFRTSAPSGLTAATATISSVDSSAVGTAAPSWYHCCWGLGMWVQ